MKMYQTIFVFLLFCFLPCYATEKVNVQWEVYAKNHITILRGLSGIEFGSIPKDVVFKTYNRPHSNETVIGLYDPPSRKIWAKNYESALHEVGHFIWHEKLSSFEQEQWIKWFNDAKVFPSFLSSYNVREFFAEHYRFFSVGKVALKLTRFDYEPKVIKKYNKIFPDQNVWFNKLETKIELGE